MNGIVELNYTNCSFSDLMEKSVAFTVILTSFFSSNDKWSFAITYASFVNAASVVISQPERTPISAKAYKETKQDLETSSNKQKEV